ncbi:hypothetical protein PTSG_02687 [Salpingoeca rosetta]|uniref:Uncharacterized protein n=1 Tax=Salpingoeca rosetta (strain ATCC 50818 / BSB-021) TaxID=946362 RepID=F2U306_SALR5|nr:uncharacterized protein PTSG_02687 [Salpingoeca rosetta]EGD82000.1 hypothetical protein PTSG_02687 [Salpingoeca rosetta]|eukprot:XP_004996183.1 hypothetical protein PTSG_02687 [Salpingoeca rosetta]
MCCPSVNLRVHSVPKLKAYENITSDGFYLPLLRVDEHGAATDDLVKQWKSQVGLAVKARDAIHIGGIIAGPVVLALCLALVIAVRLKNSSGDGADDLFGGRVNTHEQTPLMDDDGYARD